MWTSMIGILGSIVLASKAVHLQDGWGALMRGEGGGFELSEVISRD